MSFPHFHFDAGIFEREQKRGLMTALEEFEEIFIDEMKKVIDRDGGATGTSEWRNMVKADQQNLSARIAGETVAREVGLPYSGSSEDWQSMRAFVIAYGTGYQSMGGGEPMHSKPGEMVWGPGLTGNKHMSTAKSEFKLPDSWNQPYTDFIDVAVRHLKNEYDSFQASRKDEIVQAAFQKAWTIG